MPATARATIRKLIDGATPQRMVPEPEKPGSVKVGKLAKQHRVCSCGYAGALNSLRHVKLTKE